MNTSSTFTTAIVRGLYVAVLTGLIAGIAFYQQSGNTDEKGAIITGVAAGLGALAVRGGVEGFYDTSRQAAGNVKSSDVQPIDKGEV